MLIKAQQCDEKKTHRTLEMNFHVHFGHGLGIDTLLFFMFVFSDMQDNFMKIKRIRFFV